MHLPRSSKYGSVWNHQIQITIGKWCWNNHHMKAWIGKSLKCSPLPALQMAAVLQLLWGCLKMRCTPFHHWEHHWRLAGTHGNYPPFSPSTPASSSRVHPPSSSEAWHPVVPHQARPSSASHGWIRLILTMGPASCFGSSHCLMPI